MVVVWKGRNNDSNLSDIGVHRNDTPKPSILNRFCYTISELDFGRRTGGNSEVVQKSALVAYQGYQRSPTVTDNETREIFKAVNGTFLKAMNGSTKMTTKSS